MLLRASLDGTSAAEYQFHEGHRFVSSPVLAGGLLFCAMTNYLRNGGDGQIEIFAVDVQTMQLRHRFGGGLLGYKFHAAADRGLPLAVGGDELYASVAGQDCLQVFSLTGVHRRSARGEWREPGRLCCAKDRVYLVASRNADDDGCGARSLLVLSKQGDILQVLRIGCGRDIFTRSFRSTASCWCTGAGTMKLRVNSDDSLRRQRGVLGCSN